MSSFGDINVTSATPGTGATNLGKAAGNASGATDTGVAVVAVRNDVPDTTVPSANGKYAQININRGGTALVQVEASLKQTFRAASAITTLATSCTDFWNITGSGSKTVKINKITLILQDSGTAVVLNTVLGIKRSTADTTGTSVSVVAIPLDSGNAAATATVKMYTVNPGGLGTQVGGAGANFFNYKFQSFSTTASGNTIAPASANDAGRIVLYQASPQVQPLTLRGTADQFCLNLNTATQTGTSPTAYVEVEWTEE